MKIQVEDTDTETRVVVSGDVTEESDFTPLLETRGSRVVLDLSRVARMNSCGVREWLNFVAALKPSGRVLQLDRCSPAIVAQLNAIHDFAGGGKVSSVLGPYYCADCDREELHFIDLSRDEKPPEGLECPDCGNDMEFDDLRDHYLGFREISRCAAQT